MARVKRVHHTGISVSDIERSLTFYRDLLGLEVVFDTDIKRDPELEAVVGMEDVRARVVWLGAGGETTIELWQYDHPAGRPLPSDYRPADRGVTHCAFEVDDVDAVYQRIVEAGYVANTTPQDLVLNKATYVRGPDDEIVEILQDQATDEQLRTITEATVQRRERRRTTGNLPR